MVKAFISSLLLAFSLNAAAVPGPAALTINNPSAMAYLIPYATQSCAMRRNSTGAVTYDVPGKYFSLPAIKFSWADPNTTLYIASIFIKFDIPSSHTSYTCTIAGSELAATYSSWWTTGVASVSSKEDVSLNCPLVCGDVVSAVGSSDAAFSADTKMDVIGYAQDAQGKQTPVTQEILFKVINQGH